MIDRTARRANRNKLLWLAAVLAALIALGVGARGHAQEAGIGPVDLGSALCPLIPAPQEPDADLLLPPLPELPSPGQSIHELRVARASVIVRGLYNHEGRANFLPYVEHLVSQHEWYEREGTRKGYPYAEGFGAAYYYSLVYGGANADLKCYVVFPGSCCGPMDVKRQPLVLDPKRNVEWHVAEFWTGQRKGYRDLGLCRYTMLPSAPRDWGRGRFRKTDAKHRTVTAKAYAEGRL